MPRIQQLSVSVINKIAAGEVIERPASVVKELLENCVDALATRIDVEIVNGGSELIRIVDDGEGIHPDDLLLAVTSHATSKIRNADDLFGVQTMGFRGEALASVAEVSRLRVRSRQADQPHGRELTVNLGEVAATRECGCPCGTQIEIRNLFENTPVRRKFLKTVSTEFGHISEQFTRIALANPRLHMVLRHHEKLVMELPASSGLLDRLQLFFGNDIADELIAVESTVGGVRMWGYVGHPNTSKSTRKMQYLFLNGRWITDRSLLHALTEAYRGLLMVGRQPVAFLFIELPPDRVDVNVHPTKVEVRFQEGQQLFRQLLSMVRSKFLSMDLQSSLRLPAPPASGFGTLTGFQQPATRSVDQRRESQNEFSTWASEEMSGRGLGGNSGGSTSLLSAPRASAAATELLEPWEIGHSLSTDSARAESSLLPASAPSDGALPEELEAVVVEDESVNSFDAVPSDVETDTTSDASTATVSDISQQSSGETIPHPDALSGRPGRGDDEPLDRNADELESRSTHRAQAVGTYRAMQVHDCYLIVETAEGVSVIDQHALHERIMYEHLRTRVLAGAVESQRLLVPQPIEVTSKEAAVLLDQSESLERAGLGIEDFGNGTLIVTRYPAMLRRVDLRELVRDLIEKLEQAGAAAVQASPRRDILDELLHMMSCKAAVKAGQRLSQEEIESLLTQRHLVDDAHHCPHGRPTALSLSRTELDRQFGRLG